RVGRAGREGVAITLVEPREHRMLKTIRRETNGQISVEKLPTVADLHARRMELTRAALYESLVEDDAGLDPFRVVVEPLAEEFDTMEIALAAVTRAHEASGAVAEEEEIPEPVIRTDRGERPGRGRRSGPGRGERRGRGPSDGMIRLFVGIGRNARVRPQDLVGAIAGETELSGRDIGAIEIAARFSLVEVPESTADGASAAPKTSHHLARLP